MNVPSSYSNQTKLNLRREFFCGMRESIPVALGFIPFALVLGVMASQKELSAWMIALMTGLNFAGGSEFVAVSLWTSSPSIFLIVMMSFLVNIRHVVMGAIIAPYLHQLNKKQSFGLLFLMCDEVWAMAWAEKEKYQRQHLNVPYYLGVACLLYTTWVSFTAMGAYFSSNIGDLSRFGFDMALTAIFLVLLKGMWQGYKASLAWVVSFIVAGVLYHLVEGAWYVMGGVLSGIATAWIMERNS